jgi:hypothetical protein
MVALMGKDLAYDIQDWQIAIRDFKPAGPK